MPVAALDRLSGLSLQTKAVYFILATGSHRTACPGLSRAGRAQLTETCETTPETFAACIAELEARGLVLTDFSARVVFMVHAPEDDPPSSGKNVAAWRAVFDELPACDVTRQAWRLSARRQWPATGRRRSPGS